MATDYRLHDNHTVTLMDPESGFMWAGPVHQFMAENEFDAEQQADIHLELSVNGVYRGGGGASPIWELYDRLMPSPPLHGAKVRA